MRKMMILILVCLGMTACSEKSIPAETTAAPTEVSTQLANPWKDYASLEEAEAACLEREARCDAYEKALTQRLQKFYDQRPGLKELVQKAAAE